MTGNEASPSRPWVCCRPAYGTTGYAGLNSAQRLLTQNSIEFDKIWLVPPE